MKKVIPEKLWWCESCNSECFELYGTCRACGNPCREMSDPTQENISTMSSDLPNPSRSIILATEFLCSMVDEDCGTKNGKTALYWNLIHTVQKHMKKSCAKDAAK